MIGRKTKSCISSWPWANAATVDPYSFDVDLYHVDSLRDLAEQFVDEGLYGDIPDHLAHYIDYEAIARDLAVDFSMIEIDGGRLAYACR